MSLTLDDKYGNYNTVASYKVMLDLLRILNDLQDTKAIEKAAKEVYGLSEKEEKLASEARERIAEFEDAIEANNAIVATIEKEKKALDQMEKDLRSMSADLDAREANIQKRDVTLTEREKKYEADSKKLIADRITLDDSLRKLSEDQISLKQQKESIDIYETELKKKAEKLKTLTESI